jgi:EmrB/QacA subfamily drug resistance transporter
MPDHRRAFNGAPAAAGRRTYPPFTACRGELLAGRDLLTGLQPRERSPIVSTTSRIDRRRGLALALLCSAFFMVILDVAIVNVALPSIEADLGFSQRNLQWVVSAYALTFGGLLLLGGRAADLLGRRRVFVAGVVVFALASLLGGLASAPGLLVAARALQGLGAAAMTPAALSILMTAFPEGAERNKALGAWGAVGASGGTIGLLVGGVLTETVGWEWIFLLNVPIGAAVIALSPVLLDETRAAGMSHRFDLAGAITVTAALSLLVYGIVDADRAGWRSAQTLVIAAVVVVLLAAFAVVERRSSSPLLPLHVLRLRTLLGSNAAGLLFGAAMFGMFFIITLYLQQVLGYSPLHAGFAWLALSLTALLASAGGAQLVTRIGPRGPLVAGLSVAAAGIWLLSRLPAEAAYVSDVMLPLIVSGAGIGLAFVTMSIGALEGIDDHDAGLASGLVNTTQQIGGALGVALLSTVALDRFKSAPAVADRTASAALLTDAFGDALVVGAVLAGAGALVAAVLLRTRASRPRAAAAGAHLDAAATEETA